MEKKKVLAITAGALTIVTLAAVAGVFGIYHVSALINSGNVPTIIQNLAEKFNVSTSDVQKVFDDTKTQQETARLDELVEDGKITEAQKQLIIDKRTETETKVTEINNKQMTTTERADALKALRDDLSAWAKTNGIDEQYILMVGGMGRGLNFGADMMGGRRGGAMDNR